MEAAGTFFARTELSVSARHTMLLEEEEMREWPLPEKKARFPYKNGTPTEEQSMPPNYVKYEGEYYTSQISRHFNKAKRITPLHPKWQAGWQSQELNSIKE